MTDIRIPSMPVEEMVKKAHDVLIKQGFTKVGGDTYEGNHYTAVITRRPGLTMAQLHECCGLPAPPAGGSYYRDVVIEYKAKKPENA